MKTKLLTICLLLFTSQVFAHDASSGFYKRDENDNIQINTDQTDTHYAIINEQGISEWHEHLKEYIDYKFKCKEDISTGLRYENRQYRPQQFRPVNFDLHFFPSIYAGIVRFKERMYTDCKDLKYPGPNCRYIERYWNLRIDATEGSNIYHGSFKCTYISSITTFECFSANFLPQSRERDAVFRFDKNTKEFMYSRMNFRDNEQKGNRYDTSLSSGFCFKKKN